MSIQGSMQGILRRNFIRVTKDYLFGGFALYLGQENTADGQRTVYLAEPLTLHKYDTEGVYASPSATIQLELEGAQQLMDELWNCGVRPTEGTGSAGSLAATQKHLNDMRAIAANRMGMELPK